jgi:hypothetical protein
MNPHPDPLPVYRERGKRAVYRERGKIESE